MAIRERTVLRRGKKRPGKSIGSALAAVHQKETRVRTPWTFYPHKAWGLDAEWQIVRGRAWSHGALVGFHHPPGMARGPVTPPEERRDVCSVRMALWKLGPLPEPPLQMHILEPDFPVTHLVKETLHFTRCVCSVSRSTVCPQQSSFPNTPLHSFHFCV